jgi:uncharacterized membrane protein YbhN (UPF0104 family)
MLPLRSRLRVFLSRHLYSYLAAIVAVAGAISLLLGREELEAAFESFDPRWFAPILLLSLINYSFRFLKWHSMLRCVGAYVPWRSSARIYLACFSMVVTPFRLGEAYKLVFLKQLHGVSMRRTGPVLLMERVTDVAAILALASWRFSRTQHFPLWPLVVLFCFLVGGSLLAHEAPRRAFVRLIGSIRPLAARAATLGEVAEHNAALLRPRVLAATLGLSLLGWWLECVALAMVLRGLGSHLPLSEASWIYAAATALGNLTFLPGGLGGTEASLILWMEAQDVAHAAAVAATLLVRFATLWFAVLLGLSVSFVARKSLRWSEVQREAERLEVDDEGA